MPKRTGVITADDLRKVPAPTGVGMAGMVSHDTIITHTLKTLEDQGFNILSETYRSNNNADLAQGIYHIQRKHIDLSDTGMSMMFTWSNSYDKTMKMKSAVGGYIDKTDICLISSETATKSQRGASVQQMLDVITDQITNIGIAYATLFLDKNKMEQVPMTVSKEAELVGRLVYDDEILTGEQVTYIKGYTKANPSKNLWDTYVAICYGLKRAHPRHWMDYHKQVHAILKAYAVANTPDPLAVKAIADAVIAAGNAVLESMDNSEPVNTHEEPVTLGPGLGNQNVLMSHSFEIVDFSEKKVTVIEEVEEKIEKVEPTFFGGVHSETDTITEPEVTVTPEPVDTTEFNPLPDVPNYDL